VTTPRRLSLMIAAAAIAAVAVAPTAALADVREDAKARNSRGIARLKAGDPSGALHEFEEAYAIYPSSTLLLHIGTAQKQLGRNADAANTFQRYLDDPGAEDRLVPEVRTALDALDRTVGRVSVVVDAAAEVQIGDGAWLPAVDVRLVRVNPGSYVVRAHRDGRDAEATLRVAAGEATIVELAFPAAEPAIPSLPVLDVGLEIAPRPAPPPPRRRGRRWAVVTAAGTAIALGASVGLGFAALRDSAAAGRRCPSVDTCQDFDAARRLSDRGKLERALAIGVGVAAVAGAATTVVLWARGSGEAGVAVGGRF
jgi:tetratricopeptide (TPR) repeat protein